MALPTAEYVKIVEELFEKVKKFTYVGKHMQRWDAIEKILGKARFTADYANLYRNLAYVYSVRTKYAHARIRKIDVSEAEKVPGVLRVITHKDIPGVNDVGYVIPDQPLLAYNKVRYIGDIVALIVADDPYVAEEAAEKVYVDYEPLPVILDPLEIVDPVTLEEKKHVLIHDERESDVVARYRIRTGDVKKGFEQAAVIIENEYRTQYVEHAYMEPEAALAIPEPDGGITVIASTQCPYEARRAIAKVLAMPFNKIRVVVPPLGGGFGGKEDVANEIGTKAALAALLTGRPAIAVHKREESVIGHSKRHPAIMWYKHGATRDGKLVAVEARIILDTGAYASLGPFVAWRATVHTVGPYRVPNAKVDTVAVYTNGVYAGAFRGFGNPQIHFAVEQQMDLLAEELGMDPVEFRLKNVLRNGDRTVHGQLLDHGVGLEEALVKAAEAADWYRKRAEYAKQTGTVRRGIGVALLWHGNSIGAEGADYSAVSIIINRDGSITFRTGLTDMGQGAIQGLIMLAAEVLGVPPEYFRVEMPDTASVPDAGPTVASRSTAMGGNATLVAAYKLRKKLNEVAADLLKCDPDDVEIRAPEVYCRSDPTKKIRWIDLVEECFWRGVSLQEYGYYRAPKAKWDDETGHGEPYFTYTFGAIIAEVVVDMETGKTYVERMVTAYDIGRVVNRVGAELHAEGGAIQGLGYELMEE
ncbi:MAG: aldehyde oxidase, partial [Thermoprotei archaeon]